MEPEATGGATAAFVRESMAGVVGHAAHGARSMPRPATDPVRAVHDGVRHSPGSWLCTGVAP